LTDGSYSYMGSWSPDGRRIAYTQANGGKNALGQDTLEIYVMNVDGSGKRKLTENKGMDDERPSWSPDSRWILFTRGGIGNAYDVFVIRPDGTDERRVTRTGDSHSSGWSPNGNRIVFTRIARTLRSTAAGIYIVKADGRQARRLTRGDQDYEPTWSPDGRWILFTRQSSPGVGIVIAAAESTARHRLTKHVNDLGPTWSPDGRKIAFERGAEIWVMNRDGTGLHRITRRRGTAQHAGPRWAPS
jgi:TolB protein